MQIVSISTSLRYVLKGPGSHCNLYKCYMNIYFIYCCRVFLIYSGIKDLTRPELSFKDAKGSGSQDLDRPMPIWY